MDPWNSGRPDVSHDPGGTGMSVPQSDPIRWSESKDGRTPASQGRFVAVDPNSDYGKNILSVVQRSYIDTAYKNQRWHVSNIVAISNQHIVNKYRARVQEMGQVQRPGTRVMETVMFTCLASDKVLEEVADKGYHVSLSVSSFLGPEKMGVVLSRHADVQLKVAELIVDSCWIVMFKVALGNCRYITDIEAQEERVGISPEYDCHQFTIGPDSSQSINVQASRDQVYLFEVDADGVISPRPRQVQPIFAIKIKLTGPELSDTVLAASVPGQTVAGALPSPVAVPFLDQRSEQTLAVNQTGVPSPSLLPCQFSRISPLASNSNSGLRDQQRPVVIRSGMQNQQHLVAIPSGVQNRQHPVAVPSGLQNQQLPFTIHPGLQNQQDPVRIHSGLQNQQHPVVVPPGLQNQQHPVVVPSGLQNQQHLVAIPRGLQNQQHGVVILPRVQNQQHPVAMQSVWNQAPVQGQQAVQNPAVNQAGAQNMHAMPTARSLLQNLGYNATISPRASWNPDVLLSRQSDQPLGELSLPALVQASGVPEAQPPAPVVRTRTHNGRQQIVSDYWYAHSVSPAVHQDTQRGTSSGVTPGHNRGTVPSASRLSTHALELSHGMGGTQTNPTAMGPSERSTPSSGEREPSVVPPDAASPLGLGMRLPTVISPTETHPDPVVSGPVRPIVIQPTPDVRPFFLMEPPADVEPVSASVGGAGDSQIQNAASWNLFSVGDHERVAVSARDRGDMVIDDCMADNSALWSLFSVDERAQRAARTTGVSGSHQVEPPVVSGVPTVAQNPMLASMLIGSRNAETSIAVSVDTVPEQCVLSAMSLQSIVSTAVAIQNRETPTVTAVPMQNREISTVTAVPMQNRETFTVTAMPTNNRKTYTVTAVPPQNRETSMVTALPTQNRETSIVTAMPTQSRETSTVTAMPTQSRETSTVTAMPTQSRETSTVTAMPTQNQETSMVTAVLTQNRETIIVTAVLTQNRETSTVTAVPTQNRETVTTVPASIQEMQTATAMSVQNREVVDTDITDTETTPANCIGKVIEMVSTMLPDSDTHGDVTRSPRDLLSDELDDILPTVFTGPDDILGSIHCDFDSGKEIFPAPGASEGDASQSGVEEESRIYVHADGTLELIIERQVNSSSDEDTGDDYLPYSDTASWQRFLSDERFQPKVVLHKLDSMLASSNRALWCNSEIQKGTSLRGGDDACCSHSDAGKVSASEFTDEHLSAATCNIERMDQACSAVRQNNGRPCPNDAARMNQTYSVAAMDDNSLCPSNRSHESGVNLPMRVPCRPVMKASLKSSKPSVVCGSPTKCRPCDRSRKHKVKAYIESDKASKRPCKELVSKQSGLMEGAQQTHLLSRHSKSSGVTLTKHAADAHKRSDSGKHDTKKHHKRRHKKHKCIAEDSSHKRPRKSDATLKTPEQTDGSDALSEAESLPTISAVVRRSQQRPFNPKSEAQKLSPVAKPWRPLPGKMPPMLKTVAAKLKHGYSHNMLATWQKSGKATKTITDSTSAEPGCVSFNKSPKVALVQKGDGVKPVAKASDHSIRGKPGEIRHLKARRNAAGEQSENHTTSSATLVDSARRHSLGGNINKKTVCDKGQQRTVGLKQCNDIAARSWQQRGVSEPDGARTSATCEDTGRNVWSLMGRTLGPVNNDRGLENPAARGHTTNRAGLVQSPVLSADSADSDHSAFTPVASPHGAISAWSQKPKDHRTAHKTSSHESLASVLTEAWHRSASQHAVGSSNVLHSKLPKLASKEPLKQPLLGRDPRSRRDSGQRDSALAGQDPRSRHDSGQRDSALVGQDSRSRRDSSERDPALAGQDPRSRHDSGQRDSALVGQDSRSSRDSGQRDSALVGQDSRSRHDSGQRDSALVGQDSRSSRDSGQRDSALVGQDSRSRHDSGQRDSALVGQDPRSRRDSGQRDPTLAGQDTQSSHDIGQRDSALAGQDTRSRRDSGQRDSALVGQDPRSRRDSGQRVSALAGQDTRSRRDSGQRDPTLAGQDTQSSHDSGQRDSALAGQDTRSSHDSGQRDSALAGQDTRSRYCSGQKDSPKAGQDTRSRHGSGQGDSPLVTGLKPQCGVSAVDNADREHTTPWVVTVLTLNTKPAQAMYAHLRHKSSVGSQIDPRLSPPDDRSRVRPIADVLMVTPVIPLESLPCEPDVSGGTDWGKLVPVNLPQDAWNTSDFCVACERMSSITKEYLSKPPEERHRVMLVYSAKLKKTIQQISDDEMFADGTSASISSRSRSRNSHSPTRQKKQLERQELYKVLSDIKASVAANKVKIASMPLPDKEIHRRIDRCRLDCEIINERLGQLNRFHMDQQVQVLPEVLRLCSESDKYISVERQFLFMRVRPIQLGHCSELYALKEIIEAVYEELSLMCERGVSDSRKDWLLLALGWLHTHRRKMLTEICHLEAQHVCELAELFQQRRAWYRKMQAELQKSPRQGCVMALLDNPLKYLDRRIGTMTKYLEFIQNLSSCTHHAVSISKDGVSACPKTLPQESTAHRVGGAKHVSVKPEADNLARTSKHNIIRSVCLPKDPSGSTTETHGIGTAEGCHDNTDIDDICHNETADHSEGADGEVFGDFIQGTSLVEDSIEDVTHDKSDKAEVIGECEGSCAEVTCSKAGITNIECDKSEESGGKAACSDNDADVAITESKSTENDTDTESSQRDKNNVSSDSHSMNDDDTNFTEIDMSLESLCEDSVGTACESDFNETEHGAAEAGGQRHREEDEGHIDNTNCVVFQTDRHMEESCTEVVSTGDTESQDRENESRVDTTGETINHVSEMESRVDMTGDTINQVRESETIVDTIGDTTSHVSEMDSRVAMTGDTINQVRESETIVDTIGDTTSHVSEMDSRVAMTGDTINQVRESETIVDTIGDTTNHVSEMESRVDMTGDNMNHVRESETVVDTIGDTTNHVSEIESRVDMTGDTINQVRESETIVDTIGDTTSHVSEIESRVAMTGDNMNQVRESETIVDMIRDTTSHVSEMDSRVDMTGDTINQVRESETIVDTIGDTTSHVSEMESRVDMTGDTMNQVRESETVVDKIGDSTSHVSEMESKVDTTGDTMNQVRESESQVDTTGDSTNQVKESEDRVDMTRGTMNQVKESESQSNVTGDTTNHVRESESRIDKTGDPTDQVRESESRVDMTGDTTDQVRESESRVDMTGDTTNKVRESESGVDVTGDPTNQVRTNESRIDMTGDSSTHVRENESRVDTTGETTSQVRESESGLDDSANSIYEPISDDEDVQDGDDVCQEDDPVDAHRRRSNARVVEYVYHVKSKSGNNLRPAENGVRVKVEGENRKRNNGDVCTTTKHNVCHASSYADVKPTGAMLNVTAPEGKSIDVLMNRSVSSSPSVTAVSPPGSMSKKRKHEQKMKMYLESKRLRTGCVAVQNNSPAVAERNVSKRTDNNATGRRYDDRCLPGFTGKSLSDTYLHRSCHEYNRGTDQAYNTSWGVRDLNAPRHHRLGDPSGTEWPGDERPWSASDVSSTHDVDEYFMSDDLHHNEASWFDYECGVHREVVVRGHRHHHRHRRDHKHHHHSREHLSWQPH